MTAREEIYDVVERFFDLEPGIMATRTRTPKVATARHAMFWAMYEITRSYNRVKDVLGFDHTSIMHGVKMCRKRQAESPVAAEACRLLCRRLWEIPCLGIGDHESIIRELVYRTSVEFDETTVWDGPILENVLRRACQSGLRDRNPLKDGIVPATVTVDGHQYIVRFEPVITRGKAVFELMDYEKVGL